MRRPLHTALLAASAIVLATGSAVAQSLTVDLGGGTGEGSLSTRIIQIIALVSILSVAPGIVIMTTCFTRIVVVLSLVRSALGLAQTPPNMVLVSLALFLTAHIMTPVADKAWNEGLQPLMNDQITEEQAISRIVEPFRTFMAANTRERDLALFSGLASRRASGDIQGDDGVLETILRGSDAGDGAVGTEASADGFVKPDVASSIDLRTLIPAFMISELRRAFEIGFLIFVPFLVIDMVVAAILMSMGMMMLPPVTISLPFKIVFFVLVDGWYLVAGSLARSYVT